MLTVHLLSCSHWPAASEGSTCSTHFCTVAQADTHVSMPPVGRAWYLISSLTLSLLARARLL
jgi:hypothetical protein